MSRSALIHLAGLLTKQPCKRCENTLTDQNVGGFRYLLRMTSVSSEDLTP